MKELSQYETQHVSGAGLLFATLALPFSIMGGIGGIGMGTTAGLLSAFLEKKGPIDCLKAGAIQGAKGAQIGIVLENLAYNW